MKRISALLGAAMTVLAVAAVQGTALAAPSAPSALSTPQRSATAAAVPVFNVKTYGATGNGSAATPISTTSTSVRKEKTP